MYMYMARVTVLVFSNIHAPLIMTCTIPAICSGGGGEGRGGGYGK